MYSYQNRDFLPRCHPAMKIIFDQAAKTAAMRWTAGLHQAQHSLRRFPPPPACMASGGNTARGAAEGEAAGILDQGHRLLVHADRVHLQREPGRRLAAPLLSGPTCTVRGGY